MIYSIKGKAIKNGKTNEEVINEIISAKFSVLPCLPIVDDYDGSQSPADYYSEKGTFPVSFHFLPGISINELSENFCEYLALRKIENWANKNLNQK